MVVILLCSLYSNISTQYIAKRCVLVDLARFAVSGRRRDDVGITCASASAPHPVQRVARIFCVHLDPLSRPATLIHTAPTRTTGPQRYGNTTVYIAGHWILVPGLDNDLWSRKNICRRIYLASYSRGSVGRVSEPGAAGSSPGLLSISSITYYHFTLTN